MSRKWKAIKEDKSQTYYGKPPYPFIPFVPLELYSKLSSQNWFQGGQGRRDEFIKGVRFSCDIFLDVFYRQGMDGPSLKC